MLLSIAVVSTDASEQSLARVQDVLQRHLEKFGARKELAVTWELSTTSGHRRRAPAGRADGWRRRLAQ